MSNSLPNSLYTCEQSRELDRICSDDFGVKGIVLMKRAGRAAFECANRLWPQTEASNSELNSAPRYWLVLCGGGNNAGDGYIFAGLAAQKKQKVKVLYLSNPEQLKGDAFTAYQFALREGVEITQLNLQTMSLGSDEIVVDALLGTGLSGGVRKEYQELIEHVNASGRPVLALDIPSGLCGDTGGVQGIAIKATATITFIACKIGLLTGRGPAHTGRLFYDCLGVADGVYEQVTSAVSRIDLQSLAYVVSPRERDAHKGDFGHVMVIGGDHGYGGAAIMAAESAALSGAGLTSLATRTVHIAPALTRRPELMVAAAESGQELEPLLSRPTVLVVGPGLGLSPWSEQMLQQAIASDLPMVIDADALTILAQGRLQLKPGQSYVLTPHPGEAARLLGCSVEHVQHNRIAAVKELQAKYGGVVLLKGAGTLIYDGKDLYLANVGNPGLATAGSGDVLSGVIGACMAQGMSTIDAVKYGVCLHGAAADKAVAETGERGLQASELIPYIRELMR